MGGIRDFDSGEWEIIEREARDGNAAARALLIVGRDADGSESREQRRRRLTLEHHEAIVSGAVDIGPITVHTGVQQDVRDKRDPSKLGEVILDVRRDHDIVSEDYRVLSVVLDDIIPGIRLDVADYNPGESRATFTARAYRKELEERALDGDKFAISVLTTGQPGDSGE